MREGQPLDGRRHEHDGERRGSRPAIVPVAVLEARAAAERARNSTMLKIGAARDLRLFWAVLAPSSRCSRRSPARSPARTTACSPCTAPSYTESEERLHALRLRASGPVDRRGADQRPMPLSFASSTGDRGGGALSSWADICAHRWDRGAPRAAATADGRGAPPRSPALATSEPPLEASAARRRRASRARVRRGAKPRTSPNTTTRRASGPMAAGDWRLAARSLRGRLRRPGSLVAWTRTRHEHVAPPLRGQHAARGRASTR